MKTKNDMILKKIIHKKVWPLVSWLNKSGYETTDSGDGFTNVEGGMGGALPFAHVVVLLEQPRYLVWSCQHIKRNLPKGFKRWTVEGSYNPEDDKAVIMIYKHNQNEMEASMGVADGSFELRRSKVR